MKKIYSVLTGISASVLICGFLSACSVESEKNSSPPITSKIAPKVRFRTQASSANLVLKNKTSDFTTAGFNAFRGEFLQIHADTFQWEQRDRGTLTQIDASTWGGCDSFHQNCWNKNSETYTKEFSPPLMSEIALPMSQVKDFFEQIMISFRLKSGNEIVCSANSLLYEKSNTDAFLLIENTLGCPLYQNDLDEVYDVSFLNQINFGEMKYTAGTFIRHDDGNRGGYSDETYIPDTLLKIKVTIDKAQTRK